MAVISYRSGQWSGFGKRERSTMISRHCCLLHDALVAGAKELFEEQGFSVLDPWRA